MEVDWYIGGSYISFWNSQTNLLKLVQGTKQNRQYLHVDWSLGILAFWLQ